MYTWEHRTRLRAQGRAVWAFRWVPSPFEYSSLELVCYYHSLYQSVCFPVCCHVRAILSLTFAGFSSATSLGSPLSISLLSTIPCWWYSTVDSWQWISACEFNTGPNREASTIIHHVLRFSIHALVYYLLTLFNSVWENSRFLYIADSLKPRHIHHCGWLYPPPQQQADRRPTMICSWS